MVGNVIILNRNTKSRTKVKTGCATCRIRKVKCDEAKPSCQRCMITGRNCDGYEDPFRTFNTQTISKSCNDSLLKSNIDSQPVHPACIEINSQDVDLLNRYLSTKTLFNVNLGCDEEARQILQASLTDPPVRHAILSLRALREDLENSGDFSTSVVQQTPGQQYGLQQYSMALGGLASNLSTPSFNVLKSALLCCQIFISIEQVRNNFAAMAQHIIRGLRIIHEYRVRPGFMTSKELVLANYDDLPLLDVFIIKLFAAPCKFADPTEKSVTGETMSDSCPISSNDHFVKIPDLRMIAPNMRTELTRISAITLEFLGRTSQIKSIDDALPLLSEKVALLESLETWLADLERTQTEIGLPDREPISVSFLRFFHVILKSVILGALDYSSDFKAKIQVENDRMQSIASDLTERLKEYRMFDDTKGGGERSTVH